MRIKIEIPKGKERLAKDTYALISFIENNLTKKHFGHGPYRAELVDVEYGENSMEHDVVFLQLTSPKGLESTLNPDMVFDLSNAITKKWFGNGAFKVEIAEPKKKIIDLLPKGTVVQTLIFSKDKFDNNGEALKWAKKNGFNNASSVEKENTYRVRQIDPDSFEKDSFRTIDIGEKTGVKAVVGSLKKTETNMFVKAKDFDAFTRAINKLHKEFEVKGSKYLASKDFDKFEKAVSALYKRYIGTPSDDTAANKQTFIENVSRYAEEPAREFVMENVSRYASPKRYKRGGSVALNLGAPIKQIDLEVGDDGKVYAMQFNADGGSVGKSKSTLPYTPTELTQIIKAAKEAAKRDGYDRVVYYAAKSGLSHTRKSEYERDWDDKIKLADIVNGVVTKISAQEVKKLFANKQFGKQYGRTFRYLELTPTEKGLKLSLTKEGREYVKEEKKQNSNKSDVEIIDQMFADVRSNSEYLFFTNGGDVGFWLTLDEIITYGYYLGDDGNLDDKKNEKYSEVFAHVDYESGGPLEKMMEEHGFILFKRIPKDKSGSETKGQEFRYLTLTPTEKGLKVSLTKEGREYVKDEKEQNANKSDVDIIEEMFDDVRGNSEYLFFPDGGNAGFGLTSAEMITDGYYYDDDSQLTDKDHEKDSEVYAHMDYQIVSPLEKMLDETGDGYVMFERIGKDSEMAKGGEVRGKTEEAEDESENEYFPLL